jgi:hypothetical protein
MPNVTELTASRNPHSEIIIAEWEFLAPTNREPTAEFNANGWAGVVLSLSDEGGSVMPKPFDKEAQAAAQAAAGRVLEEIEAIRPAQIPYERLRGDIELAQRLLDEPLSWTTKPTEKEARAAARKVLETIAREYDAWDERSRTIPTMSIFLVSLAKAIDPASVPKTARRAYGTRKVYFRDASQGTKAARAAFQKHFNIAREVLVLNERGKPGTNLVAKKYGMADSAVSRICTQPHVKGAVELWYKEFKTKALLETLERAARGETSDT